MDFVVFGDDWGAHPSTAQHLILNLAKGDKVIWVDSIGMRDPKLNMTDLRRFFAKGMAIIRRTKDEESLYTADFRTFSRIKPKVLPWHRNKVAVLFNNYSLSRSVKHAMKKTDVEMPILISSTPVIVKYLSSFPHKNIFYLRQDEYEKYPGCDPKLVRETEPTMLSIADRIFVTAKSLLPGGELDSKSYYLPHGVQLDHFRKVPLQPAGKKILGFFGTIDERINFQLVKEVAELVADWSFEFVGEVLYKPSWVDSIENVHFRPMVPFQELPVCISEWAAAWTPYMINEVTVGINPLKMQEYLAAGFAAHCTPLPEARMLNKEVFISDKAQEIVKWLNETFINDSEDVRANRRKSVSQEDWTERAKKFREIMLAEACNE